jgi:hypothetical protein
MTAAPAPVDRDVVARFAWEMLDTTSDYGALAAAAFDTTIADAWTAVVDRVTEHHSDAALCERLLANPHTPGDVLGAALDLAERYPVLVNAGALLSNHQATGAQIDRALAAGRGLYDHLAVEHPNVSAATFTRLITTTAPSVRRDLATRDELAPWAIATLADDPSADVAAEIARRDDTPSSMLERLAGHEHRTVRHTAINNPNCPTGALIAAATDPDDAIAIRAYGLLSARSDTQHQPGAPTRNHTSPAGAPVLQPADPPGPSDA